MKIKVLKKSGNELKIEIEGGTHGLATSYKRGFWKIKLLILQATMSHIP